MGRKIISKHLSLFFESNSACSEWFGYYNYSPLSLDNRNLLCNRANFGSIPEKKGMEIEVGYYSLQDNVWHHIGVTDSWNWQQGAMLQWIPGSESKVIYNKSKNGKLISVIHDIVSKQDRELQLPIYGLTPDGKHSITIDMERSYWCRAYHYQSVANKDKDGRVYEGDGIFDLDLGTNMCNRIISIQDIINTDYIPAFEKKKHWLEHVMVSPSGKRFVFLHRFSDVENVFDYGTRICIADINGCNLQVVSGWKKNDWSHFAWNDDDSFSIFTYKHSIFKRVPSLKSLLKKQPYRIDLFLTRFLLTGIVRLPKRIRKVFTREATYYQYYTLQSGRFVLSDKFNNDEFMIDGHPSFMKNGKTMITDSYPDQSGMQHIYAYDLTTRQVTDLAAFSLQPLGGNERCDLHPKLSFNQNCVFIDSDYEGIRRILGFKFVN